METSQSLLAISLCVLLSGCGAKTDEQAPSQSNAGTKKHTLPEEQKLITAEEMDALQKSRTVAVVFKPAGGSSGNGEVMQELQSINGVLREPLLNYDVYAPESDLSMKALKQEIEVSLDNDRRVLIENNGTPESRTMAAELLTSIVGGSIPDVAGVILMKAPEEKGGGYLTIPLFNNADVQKQIAQGKIMHPGAQNNSIENFFFEPRPPK